MLIKIIELNCNCGFNFNFKIKNPIHGHLFVRFTSPARVLTKKGYEEAKPGDFIFYRDVEEIAYSSGDWRFRHDYFRFYLEGDEMSLFDFPTSELYKAPISSKMDDLLKLITREFYSANENRRESLDLIGKLFLLGAKEHINAPGDTYSSKIKDEILSLRVEMISTIY